MEEAANGGAILSGTGGSLPVENVQSLAASLELRDIPHRYIRSELDDNSVFNGDEGDVPIIDLSRLIHSQSYDEEAAKLAVACEEWGFFQLVNHGVPDEVIERMKGVLKEFFRLPLEEKKAYAQPPGSVEGYGQAFVVSEDQKLDWADMYFLAVQPISGRNMSLWATNPTMFREAVEQYTLELKRVASVLLMSIGKNLGLENKLAKMFKDGLQSVRMNYYPPCPQASKVLGLSPHSDAVGLTVLVQVTEVQGLQIKKNDGWLPIKALPDAFIVNIGDVIEIMSNGKYKSIEHRAVINRERERISAATFLHPSVDVQIGPLLELLENDEAHYRTISCLDYLRMIFASKLEGKNILDQMKLNK